jgi:hypothetical protein
MSHSLIPDILRRIVNQNSRGSGNKFISQIIAHG